MSCWRATRDVDIPIKPIVFHVLRWKVGCEPVLSGLAASCLVGPGGLLCCCVGSGWVVEGGGRGRGGALGGGVCASSLFWVIVVRNVLMCVWCLLVWALDLAFFMICLVLEESEREVGLLLALVCLGRVVVLICCGGSSVGFCGGAPSPSESLGPGGVLGSARV